MTTRTASRLDLRGFVLPALLAIGWWTVSANGWGNSYIFITYDRIWASFSSMVADGSLASAFFGTVGRMAAGFAIGAGFGVAVANLSLRGSADHCL